MISVEEIQSIASEITERITSTRRHLHQHPELSFQEKETSLFIHSELEKIGISKIETKAGTGWVALIEGLNPTKKVIALRADMDALPIQEKNEVPYKSLNDGVMHACGHDVHTACLLGAAEILFRTKDQWEGTIKLIFQPGEELIPGGASIMIKEGALENPKPQAIFGQHVMPLLPAGHIGIRSGLYMASADEIYLKVKGKGGHGAMPQFCVDPILVSAHILVALQQIVSRNASPIIPTVLSFGKVIANGATNVIPDEAYLEGTFRTLDEHWRAKAHELIRNCVQGIATAMGAEAELEIRKGYPFLKNDPELAKLAKETAIEYVGEAKVVDLDIWMAAEDFAYYSQEMPACFYRLGTRNEEKGITAGVHTPTFDIDESSLEIGAGLMAWMAIKALAHEVTSLS